MLFYGLFRSVLTYSCLYKIYILVCLRFLPEDRMSRTRRSFRRGRRGISPVISTIIIVAVAIAISIAVAFWLGGITSIFTRFEKLEITSAYAKAESNNDEAGWNITITIKNTGTSDATITDILINSIPISEYNCTEDSKPANATWRCPELDKGDKDYALEVSLPIKTGEELTLYIWLKSTESGGPFISGQSVTITIHTAAGQDYPKTVVLS